MNKIGVILVLVCLLFGGSAVAEEKGIGVEILSGEQVGISLRKSTGANSVLSSGVAWSFVEPRMINFHVDSLLYTTPSRYYGVGMGIKYRENEDIANIFLRFPLGIEMISSPSPLRFFIELVPVLNLVPFSEIDLTFVAGALIYLR